MFQINGRQIIYTRPKMGWTTYISKGLKIGETYRNDEKAAEFLGYIALNAFSNLKCKLMSPQTKFFTIMGDDSADISAQEQSMWYLRFVQKGKIFVNLILTKL